MLALIGWAIVDLCMLADDERELPPRGAAKAGTTNAQTRTAERMLRFIAVGFHRIERRVTREVAARLRRMRPIFSRPAVRFAFIFLMVATAAAERSASPSRQFIVYGDNAQLRGAVSDLAEQVKRNTLSILREADAWKTPVLINVQRPQANLPELPPQSLRFSQTGAGLKLQLDLVIGADVRAFEIRREMLRAILLERIYRNHADIAPGTAYVQPPDWLLDGLLARFDHLNVSAPGQMSLDEFLRQRPNDLDSAARELYRAGSLALVNAIVDLAQSRGGLGRYLESLAESSSDSLGDLRAQFPEVEKLWRERLSDSSSHVGGLLRFAETETQLAQALHLKIASQERTLADFVRPKLSANEKAALQMTAQDLMLLGTNAHPVLRPIVSEYQQIAQMLAAGKRKGVSARLPKLEETRRGLVRRMDEIDDYLNWFEATRMTTSSGVFDEYIRTAQQRRGESRRDSLSTYLDAVELQTRD